MNKLSDALITVTDLVRNFEGFFALKNLKGQYLVVNDGLLKAIGQPRENIIGRTNEQIFPPHIVNEIKRTDKETYEKNTIVEYTNSTAVNGRIERFVSLKFLVTYQSGDPFFLCVIAAIEEKREQLYNIREKVSNIFREKLYTNIH